MKSPAILSRATLSVAVLLVFVLSSVGCNRTSSVNMAARSGLETVTVKSDARGAVAEAETSTAAPNYAYNNATTPEKVSLSENVKAEPNTSITDRKIIRNGSLTIEVPSTTDAQHSIVSIAETHGGFVVTSESKQRESAEPEKRALDIKLIVRVPSDQFAGALDQIRKLATNLTEENVTSQDVTEEFIDLEARIKTQTALEQQFLQIMKQAGKISDALEVQRQIADVRTDIERLEGRKRFVQNAASLSMITVNIQSPKPMVTVTSTGFGRTVRDAISESIDVASNIVIFFVQFVIVMIPVFALVLLPAGLIVRYLMRRARRMRLAAALSGPTPDEA
jgi:predicted  nucleic acid-binding Zn-ribbon protein